jgi:hypothetical protein
VWRFVGIHTSSSLHIDIFALRSDSIAKHIAYGDIFCPTASHSTGPALHRIFMLGTDHHGDGIEDRPQLQWRLGSVLESDEVPEAE